MRTVPLGEIASMKYGKLPPKELLEHGYPIFTGYRVSGYASTYLYKEPMLVVVARGVGGTGDVKISPPNAWITNLSIVLDVDKSQADKNFLRAYLSQQSLKERLDTGSAQAQITVNALEPFLVTIPSLPIQRRIASILSAYDDLIENNTRRIAILEEMARRIYEEWFVRFRFPGHEQVKMVESELGLVPEGWSVAGLFQMATVKYGKNLPTKHLVDDGLYPVYGAAKVIGRYSSYTRENRTIIAGCRGSVGQFQITEPKCFVTNNSFTFDPVQSDDFFWLYFSLCTRGLKDVIGGAAQPQITLEGIESVKLVAPPPWLRQQFRVAVESTIQLSWVLAQKNANLRATRDLLLPKLISGELDVSTLPEPEEAIAA